MSWFGIFCDTQEETYDTQMCRPPWLNTRVPIQGKKYQISVSQPVVSDWRSFWWSGKPYLKVCLIPKSHIKNKNIFEFIIFQPDYPKIT